MDYVYVIYFDGKMYKGHSRKVAYLEEKYAKQVITDESKIIAERIANEEGISWYDLTKKEEQPYINRVKERFKIKRFVEEKSVATYEDIELNIKPRKIIEVKGKLTNIKRVE